jgi:hypothetical protein
MRLKIEKTLRGRILGTVVNGGERTLEPGDHELVGRIVP